jgi:hypothetical protein
LKSESPGHAKAKGWDLKVGPGLCAAGRESTGSSEITDPEFADSGDNAGGVDDAGEGATGATGVDGATSVDGEVGIGDSLMTDPGPFAK